jgi:hypothetical protein
VIEVLSLMLALASNPEPIPAGCEPDSPVRDPENCDPPYSGGEFVLYSMESVAVGTIAEMKLMRPRARECGLSNRIDYVGDLDLAVFDIVNADKDSRVCIRSWIESEYPNLVYSKKQFDEAFERANSQQKE